MKKTLRIAVWILLAMIVSTNVFAASPWTEKTTYGEKALAKLEFGLQNLVAGWTQILSTPDEYRRADKNVLKGLQVGAGHALADTIGGALHTLTFFMTNVDIPLPENGVQI